MILSMTGYGKATGEINNKRITIEIKSLNSKQLDLSTRISGAYRTKEIELRNALQQQVERGKVELTLYCEQVAGADSLKINTTLLEQYYHQLSSLTQGINIAPPQDWLSTLLTLPDVMKQEQTEVDSDEWATIINTLNEALSALTEYRRAEGIKLEALFEEKIDNIRTLLGQIDPFEEERITKIRTKLEESLQKYTDTIDTSRLEQELIFYIEKLDVNEEKQRLAHHLDYFVETIKNTQSQGKKLGFIAQEIGREINTLGSKSNHAQMQRIVVQMKDELEQIKEQVLNAL